MIRLLTFLMIGALFLGQGFSAGAAMCVHRSAAEHARALESRIGVVAAVAQNEDSAVSLQSKKAAPSVSVGLNWVAHLAAPSAIVPPLAVSDRVTVSLTDAPALTGISTAPLLRPPHSIA
ncbi:hypothetical protein [Sphingomonas sp.]|uniref:hypothetical protein n=1 Tax=Sphingomonas sp. TaxID=28214 RepID=UPI00286A2D85|nr:hypothetical protein [Sphingomonas sp.]